MACDAVVVFNPVVSAESPTAIPMAMARSGGLPSFVGRRLLCAVCREPINVWTNGQVVAVRARKPTDGGYLAHAACAERIGNKPVRVEGLKAI